MCTDKGYTLLLLCFAHYEHASCPEHLWGIQDCLVLRASPPGSLHSTRSHTASSAAENTHAHPFWMRVKACRWQDRVRLLPLYFQMRRELTEMCFTEMGLSFSFSTSRKGCRIHKPSTTHSWSHISPWTWQLCFILRWVNWSQLLTTFMIHMFFFSFSVQTLHILERIH